MSLEMIIEKINAIYSQLILYDYKVLMKCGAELVNVLDQSIFPSF